MRSTTFLACLLALVFSCPRSPAADRPNVVLFLVDDMGWMDSSVYGSEYYETPNMERLAGQSMRFTDAYAVPLCSPSRASILTGQYSSRHGITSASGHRPPAAPGASPYPEKGPRNQPLLYAESKNYLDPGLVTLAEVLRDAGYRTGHFGKWHLGILPEHRPPAHGFETAWHCGPDPGPPSYFSPYGVHPEGRPTGQHKVGNITDGPEGEYITDRLTDEALNFIDAHRDEKFFLNLWQYGVHGPWGHKEEYTAAFAKKTDPRGEQRNPIMASMLKSVDDSLGRILDRLDALDLTDDTLFIFYSDNGGNTHSNRADDGKIAGLKPGHPKYEFVQDWRKWAGPEGPTNNAPLREGKARIYEGGQRVPLMVRWPGQIEPGTTSDAIVGPIDLFPTVIDALALDQPAGHIVDGMSFLPVLRQSGDLEREALFTWFPHLIPAVSVRQGEWKLIRRFEPHRDYPEVRELYHLTDDLGETHNLAAEMPGKVKALDALIDRFIADTGALAPRPNPDYDPNAALAAKARPLLGWVPKFCSAEMRNGTLEVVPEKGRAPHFIARTGLDVPGPLKLRIDWQRKMPAGKISVQWRTKDQDAFPEEGQRLAVKLAAGDDDRWASDSSLVIPVPVESSLHHLRLFLPGGAEDLIAITRIALLAGDGDGDEDSKPVLEWDFAASAALPK